MHNVVTIEPLAAHMGLLATLQQWLEAGRPSCHGTGGPGDAASGGVRLMLDGPAKAQFASQSSVIYHKVSDLQAAVATLSGGGVSSDN